MYNINKLFKAYIQKARHITQSSTDVKCGDIFYCIKGFSFDGHKFINQAFKQGAIAVVATNTSFLKILSLRIQNLLFFLASLSFCSKKLRKKIFFFKGAKLDIIKLKYNNLPELFAVTGTNGKTSSVHFYLEALNLIGKKAISIGTIGIRANFELNTSQMPEVNLTTPDVFSLYRILHEAKLQGAQYCAMEASSVAIQSMRLEGLEFKIASFTNLTLDHLDIHKTMENYFNAKLQLFTNHLAKGAFAVLNGDDEPSLSVADKIRDVNLVVVYQKGIGKNKINTKPNQLLLSFVNNEDGCSIYNNEEELVFFIRGHVVGFQCYNIAMVLAGLYAYFGDQVLQNHKNLSFTMPEGRMQEFKLKNNARAFVDYAHTPDALKKALEELNLLKANNTDVKIITLFGCGGQRDKTKRSQMGLIASNYSDFVVITDDNPRQENPLVIREEVIKGFKQSFTNFTSIANRAKAIEFAVEISKNNDLILIAGKGHENYQIIGNQKTHFSDAEEVLKFC